MEGVEILNQFEVVTKSAFNMQSFWITVGIVTLIGAIIGVFLFIFDECDCLVISSMLILFAVGGALIGILSGISFSTPTKYETRYQVTITDEVKMTEFNERYEILDQEGKIYTVREK
jgi:hypothetical protein